MERNTGNRAAGNVERADPWEFFIWPHNNAHFAKTISQLDTARLGNTDVRTREYYLIWHVLVYLVAPRNFK